MPLPHHLCVFQLRERGEEKIEPRRSIQGRYIRARAHPVRLYLNGNVYLAPPLTKLQCTHRHLISCRYFLSCICGGGIYDQGMGWENNICALLFEKPSSLNFVLYLFLAGEFSIKALLCYCAALWEGPRWPLYITFVKRVCLAEII
jgi:hypothetical protein